MDKKILLLQINDSAFPIGAYAHSYGLETYVQQGLVSGLTDAEAFIKSYISETLLYNDLLAVSLAYDAALKRDLAEITRIEKLLLASKNCAETREAGQKLALRFIKTVSGFEDRPSGDFFRIYSGQNDISHFHQTAYGVFTAVCGIDKNDALAGYLYAQASAMVTNCVKLIPPRQTDGQRLLYGLSETMRTALDGVSGLGMADFGRSFPGFDIRSMQHEALYSRLFMS